jgi:hypothetical protein
VGNREEFRHGSLLPDLGCAVVLGRRVGFLADRGLGGHRLNDVAVQEEKVLCE